MLDRVSDRRLAGLLAALAVLLFATAAAAQDAAPVADAAGDEAVAKRYDWYGEVGLSVTLAPKMDFDYANGTGTFDTTPGLLASAAFGRRLPFGLRVEAAYAYRFFENESTRIPGVQCSNLTATCDGTGAFRLYGETSFMTFMGNLYYDVLSQEAAMQPYIGAGVGGAYAKFSENTPQAISMEDSEVVFAWNVMAGLRFPVVDHVDSVIGYRYTRAMEMQLQTSRGQVETVFQTHDLVIALQYAF